jgi:hypothetical protein
MISHSIVVKEVKSNIVPWVAPNAPKITDNASLSKYLESLPYEGGDFLCYGANAITMLGQVNLVCNVERDFKYLTFTTYNHFPKVLELMNIGALAFPQATMFKRWDSCEALRKMTEGEIKSLIMPQYDLLLNRCKEYVGPETYEKLKNYRAV